MGGQIWYYDCYDLRKFDPYQISTFLDIGANKGGVSIQARIFLSSARIVAIEPCKEVFDFLHNHIMCWGGNTALVVHAALGDGSTMYMKKSSGTSGLNKFFTEEEAKQYGLPRLNPVRSKTLKQIFDEYSVDINNPYIIKIDCEGGERFILDQGKEAIDLIQGSVQTVMEIHLGLGGSAEQWSDFAKCISDTHVVREGLFNSYPKHDLRRKFVWHNFYGFQPPKSRHIIEFVRK
jgi:FkbM family methyltransferase|tara:strand:+ start:900 stop:1601 length:702 start_codon:yes stop_codon:yes gene_type:complete